jgi:hypothetical protein
MRRVFFAAGAIEPADASAFCMAGLQVCLAIFKQETTGTVEIKYKMLI